MDAGRSVTVPRVQFPSEPSSFPSSARSSSASSPRHGAAPFHHQLRRAIRIAEDAEAGVEAGDPDISRAIKQLEKHVTISASAHKWASRTSPGFLAALRCSHSCCRAQVVRLSAQLSVAPLLMRALRAVQP